ncbi:MAG: NapC/NirT family cytochrome c [Hyphomicrobiales bacterium]
MTEAGGATKIKGRSWRRFALFGVPIVGAAVFFIAGIIFWGGFNTAMEATNTLGFCISCHEMEDTVYQEYKKTIHFQNRTGVRAVCSDCHVPDPWIHKVIRKVKASRELYHKVMGTIDTPAKFEEHRLELAKNVWHAMKTTDSRECRNCHNFQSMAPEFQRPRARKQHLNAFETGQTCIDCHKGIAHKNVRDMLTDEELETLEKPSPAYVREVPQSYLDSLARIEAKEADEAAKAEADAKAAEDAVKAKIASAVEAARAEEQKKAAAMAAAAAPAGEGAAAPAAAAPAAPAAAGGTVASNVDWNAVPAKTVTLFYPGQASFEWVQNGKDHGGARPFTKGGDRCSTCHAKELKDMGTKIVTGTKAEPTPIPGKRPAIDMNLQAVHDDQNLYLRLQWPNAEHTPVPFVDGGKMDPENQIKVAMMISGTGIDKVDQAGCWVTCHHDSRYMPDAPDAAALEAAKDVATKLGVTDGVTKYIAESRTEIEIKGRDDSPRGGWKNLKADGDLEAMMQAGSFMDLLRVKSGGAVENGHIVDHRAMNDPSAVAGEAKLEGDTWTVVISRPLAPNAAGDINLEAGKTYTVGFAIHDDYTTARFHHVSLEYHLGLDDGAADINVVKQ